MRFYVRIVKSRCRYVSPCDGRKATTVVAYDHRMGERLLSEAEVAEYLNVSIDTMRRWRREGTGPPYVMAGSRPRYRREDVDRWLERQARREH
jgi:excisionase family DNA binding protein